MKGGIAASIVALAALATHADAWRGEAVLALAGGHVGLAAAVLWSVAFGCVVAATLVALTTPPPARGSGIDDGAPVTIRGPLSYAGPGSLGGTKSALRR